MTRFPFRGEGLGQTRRSPLPHVAARQFFVAEFRSLVGGVGTMQKLRGVIKWLPTDEFDFSLERFADADITLPKPHNTTAPVERAAELVEEGDDVCILNALVGDIGLAFWVPLGLAAVVGYAMLRDDDTDARLNPA